VVKNVPLKNGKPPNNVIQRTARSAAAVDYSFINFHLKPLFHTSPFFGRILTSNWVRIA
jgi:hypothetical protein